MSLSSRILKRAACRPSSIPTCDRKPRSGLDLCLSGRPGSASPANDERANCTKFLTKSCTLHDRSGHCHRSESELLPLAIERAGSIPRMRAASSRLGVRARIRRICSASSCSRVTGSPTSIGAADPAAERDAAAMMRSGQVGQVQQTCPLAKIAARSMALRSSRRLPGQPYRDRASRASGVKPSIFLPSLSGEEGEEVLGQGRPVRSVRGAGAGPARRR